MSAAARVAARSAPRRGQLWSDHNFVPLTIAPVGVLMLLVFGLPLAFSAYLSTVAWSMQGGLFSGTFVGLDNYADLLGDDLFLRSLGLTLAYTAIAVTAELVLGLGVALLLNMSLAGISFFRATLIIPMMMTPIVAALCWKLLLDPRNGIVNYLLRTDIIWLGHAGPARFSVLLVNVWQNTPYVALLLLAGLRALPASPLEAAAIDGASRWQTFRHVVLPLLQPYLMVAVLLRTIFELRAFENVYTLTSGGPANATLVLSVFTYMQSFVSFDLSLGAAASWVMLLIAMVLCMLFVAALQHRRTA